jgi:integrase
VARAKRLKERFGSRLAAEVTTRDVEDFKLGLLAEKLQGKTKDDTRHRSPASVNQYLKLLRAIYNRAKRHGTITVNPVIGVAFCQEHNTRNRCLNAEEESRLLRALPAWLAPLVTVAIHTGMRKGELRGLRWADVDFATGTLHIPQDKAGSGRWVIINSVARQALLTIKREQTVMSPWGFCSPQGRFLHNLERYWRPFLKAASISDFRFHDLRHTFASRLAMDGVDLYTVQRAGGWKTHVMVQRYAHLSPDHMRAAVERLAKAPRPVSVTKSVTRASGE